MASESTSQSLPKSLTRLTNIHFELADGHITFNNSVSLLESKFPEHQDMLKFLSNCCILKALIIQPSVIYNKYLRDFWYSTKVVHKSITFSLLNVEKSLSFDREICASVIGLEYSKEYVSLPDHEGVKDAIATLGLSNGNDSNLSSKDLAHLSLLRLRYFFPTWKVLTTYLVKFLGGNQGSHDQLNVNQQMIAYGLCWGLDIDIAGILYDDLVYKLTANGKKGREKNICYTRYMSLITSATFKKPTSSEVPLTCHMRKVAKIDEEPLITTSKEANHEASGAMSLSGTSEHPDSTPKAKTDKKRRKKKTPSSSKPNVSKEVTADTTQSLDASMSAEEQDNQPKTADTKKDQENVVTEEVHMGDDGTEFVDPGLYSIDNFTLESLNQTADESPFDTESEIKFVKSFKPITNDEESLFTSKESDTEEDSELASILDDEIRPLSAF
ncbi:hypothetical protein Tco_0494214 [Tanacetum coccineum]